MRRFIRNQSLSIVLFLVFFLFLGGQSIEFLAVGSMVVFSVFLRQRWSAESKPVDAPHSETGE